jgi:hypothetical protein
LEIQSSASTVLKTPTGKKGREKKFKFFQKDCICTMSDSQDYQPVSQIAEESEVVMSLQSPAGEKMKVSCWQ